MSSIDKFYRVSRSTVLPMFAGGWGDPGTIKKLLDTKLIYTDQKDLKGFITANQPNIEITKKEITKTYELKEGTFESPFNILAPGLMEKNNAISRFQLIRPIEWPTKYRPIVIHLAGTGDHNYWSRKWLLAYSLLKEGIGSILLVNPYYGDRKPKDQRFSSLKYVSDLFVMGGSLIMECQTLLNWCGDHHYGPFAVHGISMGGFMASLAGSVWPHPISIVPCLSWSTASPVFVDGVISSSVCWKKLSEDYYNDTVYSKEIRSLIQPSVPPHYSVSSHSDEDINDLPSEIPPNASPSQLAALFNVSADIADRGMQSLFYLMNRIKPERTRNNINEDSDDLAVEEKRKIESKLKETDDAERLDVIKLKKEKKRKPVHYHDEEVRLFMREILDTFTHLGHYSLPVDSRLAILVSAKDDAYVPRNGVISVDKVWPDCEIRKLDGMGHVGAYIRNAPLFGRTDFRDAIRDSINLQLQLYYGERHPFFINPDNKDVQSQRKC